VLTRFDEMDLIDCMLFACDRKTHRLMSRTGAIIIQYHRSVDEFVHSASCLPCSACAMTNLRPSNCFYVAWLAVIYLCTLQARTIHQAGNLHADDIVKEQRLTDETLLFRKVCFHKEFTECFNILCLWLHCEKWKMSM